MRGRSTIRTHERVASLIHNLFTQSSGVAAIAIIAALALASCGDDGPSSSSSPSVTTIEAEGEPATTIPVDRDAAVASAIDVRASGCGPRVRFGTGTRIADELIVTAAHVVAGAGEVKVVDSSGATTTAEVVFFDPDLDIAALRPSNSVGTPIELRRELARAGESGIIVLARLVAGVLEIEIVDVRILRRVNIRTTDIYLDNDVERDGFEVAAQIKSGDSGALVHLPGGGVGIIWARSTANADRAWAVNIPDLLLDPTTRGALVHPVDNGACSG